MEQEMGGGGAGFVGSIIINSAQALGWAGQPTVLGVDNGQDKYQDNKYCHDETHN